jgi:hypothetical protein
MNLGWVGLEEGEGRGRLYYRTAMVFIFLQSIKINISYINELRIFKAEKCRA